MKKILTSLITVCISFLCSISAFATDGEVRYSNELTSSPIRIFFAALVVVLFIVAEIAVEKIREKHVAKRNQSYEKDDEEK